jgi:DNA-binding NarL/FixJ family response regulator
MSDPLRPATSPAVATVVGGDARDRLAIVELLRADGFEIRPTGAAGGVVILLGARAEAERLREIRDLAERNPASSVIAVMPSDTPNASLRRSLLAGAAGIVFDDEASHALVATAHAILAGQLAVPSALGRQIAPRPLSHREKQILGLVVLGLTNREIANRLFLAESTVKTHLSSAFRKVDARSRAEAVARIQDPEWGYGAGILELAAGLGASAA